MIEKQFIKPSIPLDEFIQYYFIYSMDKHTIRHKYPKGMSILPCTYGRLGIFFNTPSLKYEEDGSVVRNPIIGISGFYSKVRKYNSNTDIKMLIIGFKPTGLQRMLDFPVSDISNQNVNLKEIFPLDHEELMDKLYTKRRWNKRIEILEAFLIKKLKYHDSQRQLEIIIDHLFHNFDSWNVKDLASKYFMSEKTLQRRFINGIGLTPKKFIKLVRFQKSLKLISSNYYQSLGSIAYRLGYYDQAHFIHEFTQLYGKSPKFFLKKKRSVLGKYYDKKIGRQQHSNLAYV